MGLPCATGKWFRPIHNSLPEFQDGHAVMKCYSIQQASCVFAASTWEGRASWTARIFGRWHFITCSPRSLACTSHDYFLWSCAVRSMQTIFRSKQVHRNNKIRLYKTLIKPVLCYGSVTWTLTQTSEQMLNTCYTIQLMHYSHLLDCRTSVATCTVRH
jgi:hypothetical protein